VDLIDQRIKVLGDTLRAEMQQAYAAHQQALKANAILQWIATAGRLAAYMSSANAGITSDHGIRHLSRRL
jgi:hypothetical protein